jgi:hypothetical protein
MLREYREEGLTGEEARERAMSELFHAMGRILGKPEVDLTPDVKAEFMRSLDEVFSEIEDEQANT